VSDIAQVRISYIKIGNAEAKIDLTSYLTLATLRVVVKVFFFIIKKKHVSIINVYLNIYIYINYEFKI
jgi:hypothetical protein